MERPETHTYHVDTATLETREMNDEEYNQYLIDIKPKGQAPE